MLVGGLCAVLSTCKPTNGYKWTSQKPLSIREVRRICTKSGLCNNRYCCEGKTVTVIGYLDFVNIFDKKHYPNLPYQKFRIIDGLNIPESTNPWKDYSEFLEVFVTGSGSEDLFEKISNMKGLPLKQIVVTGTIKGFNAYTNSGYSREIYLEAMPDNILINN